MSVKLVASAYFASTTSVVGLESKKAALSAAGAITGLLLSKLFFVACATPKPLFNNVKVSNVTRTPDSILLSLKFFLLDYKVLLLSSTRLIIASFGLLSQISAQILKIISIASGIIIRPWQRQ
jgi:hypothetical protein